ncbi:MAG: GDSL-type esterase/lipase family protein [Pseudomonadota bacterium]
MLKRAALAACILQLCMATAMAQGVPPGCGSTPAPREQEFAWMSIAQWHRHHDAHAAIADKDAVDLLFVGDSITMGWDHAIWQRAFGRYRTANFGIGGDTSGNLLWRLRDGHAGRLHPRAVVLMIGVNNLGYCKQSPVQAFAGVRAVVEQLRSLYPQARILLNAVFPHGQSARAAQRAPVAELNRLLARLDDGAHVFFHDYGALLLQSDGAIAPEIMADFLHPTPQGYQIWADALSPDIAKLMK